MGLKPSPQTQISAAQQKGQKPQRMSLSVTPLDLRITTSTAPPTKSLNGLQRTELVGNAFPTDGAPPPARMILTAAVRPRIASRRKQNRGREHRHHCGGIE